MSDEIERTLEDAESVHVLMTWQEAETVVNKWFANWWREFELRMTPFETNWRGWQGKRTAYRIYLKIWGLAHVHLAANLLPQNRAKRGIQRVKTARFKVKERRGGVELGTFNGKPAWKRSRGRPPLGAQEALKRWHDRILSKRKRNKTKIKHKDRKKLPTEPPKTKTERPTTGENFGKAGVPKNRPEKTVNSPSIDWGKIGEDVRKQIAEEIGKGIGELAWDKASDYMEKIGAMFETAIARPEPARIEDDSIGRWFEGF